MKKVLATAAMVAIVAAAGSANAALVTFDFTGFNPGSGNTGFMTVAGYTLQVDAWTAQFASNWAASSLPGSTITHITGQGLGVANSTAGTNNELDANTLPGAQGYQDWLSFKLTNPPAVGTAKYASVTYSGLDLWTGNNVGDFSQARISTQSGGVLQGGANPLGGPNSIDQLGTGPSLATLALPANFINGNWYLLVGPRLSGINNSFTGGAGDSFRVAAVTMDIPGAVVTPIPAAAWLLGSGLLGLAGLRRKQK